MPYLRGLDGLRALAVVAVLLYHSLDVDGLPSVLRPTGGFLGVEVFFVISGYLITALILDEHDGAGGVGLVSFWKRRARRLLPALYLLLAGVVVMAALFAHDAFDNLRAEILGAVFYVTNWLLIFQDQSYFDTTGRPSLLRHLWSLAIEEQFYIVWPVVVVGGLRLFGKRALFVATVAAAAASTLWMWLLFDRIEQFGDVTSVYYRTDTRAAALLIGGAAALVWRPWCTSARHRPWWTPARLGAEVIAVGSLIAVVWAQYRFSDNVADWANYELLFRGGFLLTSVPTVLLIGAVAGPGSLTGRLLGLPGLRWIGTRSYGLYLWHWPVFQLTRPGVDVTIDGWELLGFRLVVTALLAEVSYRFVEQPVRQGRFVASLRRSRDVVIGSPRRPVRWATLAGVVAVATLAGAFQLSAWLGDEPADESDDDTVVAAAPAVPTGPPRSPTAPPVVTTRPTATARPTTAARPQVWPTRDGAPTLALGPDPDPAVPRANPTPLAGIPAAAAPAVEAPQAETPKAETPKAETSTPEPDPSITIIGDAVVLGSEKQLVKLGDDVLVDARVGRQWWEAAEEIEELAADEDLGDVVVVHLGNNGPLNDEMFDEVMDTIGPEPKVVVVNVKVPASWEATVNEQLADGVERWPDQAVLVDWHARADGRRKLFAGDGLHLERSGQRALRKLIGSAIDQP